LGINGKRSRNPSTSSGYGGIGIKITSRNRRASEGDNWTEVGSSGSGNPRGGRRGGSSSRHSSGGQGGGVKPYRGRHSTENSWSYSSSYQDKSSYSGRSSAESGSGLGRRNPTGPRKRANSTSEQVTKVQDKVRTQRSRQPSEGDQAMKAEQ